MHHRRKRKTSKRENKRLDNKSARQAAKRAIGGGSKSSVPRAMGWAVPPMNRQTPVLDQPSNGKNRSKRKRPKKEKCPVNRTHEWYPEVTEKVERRTFYWGFRGHRKYTYFERVKTKTCIHCWKEKVIKREIDWNY